MCFVGGMFWIYLEDGLPLRSSSYRLGHLERDPTTPVSRGLAECNDPPSTPLGISSFKPSSS